MEGRQHRAGLSSYALQEKVRLYNEAVLVISSVSSTETYVKGLYLYLYLYVFEL